MLTRVSFIPSLFAASAIVGTAVLGFSTNVLAQLQPNKVADGSIALSTSTSIDIENDPNAYELATGTKSPFATYANNHRAITYTFTPMSNEGEKYDEMLIKVLKHPKSPANFDPVLLVERPQSKPLIVDEDPTSVDLDNVTVAPGEQHRQAVDGGSKLFRHG